MEVRSTWQIVKELEEKSDVSARELGEIRATLLANFGPEGKALKGIVQPDMKTFQMLITVCEHLLINSKK